MEDSYLTAAIIALGKHIYDLEGHLRVARGDTKKWEEKYKELKEEARKYEDSHDA